MKSEKQKNIIIVGFGFEGRCAFSYFKKKYPKARIAIADQNIINNPPKGVETFFGKNYLEKIGEFDLIIKSPGVPAHLPEFKKAIKNKVEITTATNLFFSQFRDQIIGVTATKGKSTTATLIYKILKQAGKEVYLLGNIGDANPYKFLNKKPNKNLFFVYELSSYQLADLNQSPRVAVWLNIFPDHLPYHGSFAKYQKAKANISLFQNHQDWFIYNSSFQYLKNLVKKSQAQKVDYLNKCVIKNNAIFYGAEKIVDIKKIKLLGEHNFKNIMAVICAVKILGIKNTDIEKAISSFKGLEHRLEFVKKVKGIEFYDDAISTTPESTMAGMEVFGDRLGTMILGGQDRGYNFKNLAKKIFELKIKNIILFPDSGKTIWQEIEKVYQKNKTSLPKKLETSNMKEAVQFAYKNTTPGKVCLLSTASPSYSIFKNFKEKGDLFKKEVKKL